MTEVYTLPPDLTPEERAAVEAFRRAAVAKALAEADERAALWVRVRRAFGRFQPRYGRQGGLAAVRDEARLPVSVRTARRIVDGEEPWAVPD